VFQLLFIIPGIAEAIFFSFGVPGAMIVLSVLPIVVTILNFILWYNFFVINHLIYRILVWVSMIQTLCLTCRGASRTNRRRSAIEHTIPLSDYETGQGKDIDKDARGWPAPPRPAYLRQNVASESHNLGNGEGTQTGAHFASERRQIVNPRDTQLNNTA
jgi:hypothetical protein